MSLAIIGVSGRNNLIYTRRDYDKMIDFAYRHVLENNITSVVSGGCSLADHVAIKLYLSNKINELTLYLPCQFNIETARFDESIEGKRLNQLHCIFSCIILDDSLNEIKEAINSGAKVIIKRGFKNRNTQVAKCEYLLAFLTNGTIPKSGGTLDTWNKNYGSKVGISIYSL